MEEKRTYDELWAENEALKKQLAEQEAYLSVFDKVGAAVGDVIALFDNEQQCLYLSPSVKAQCGFGVQEVLAKGFDYFLHPDDRASVSAYYMALSTKNEDDRLNFRMQHKDGHYFWVESLVRNFCTADGQLLFTVVASREIDGHKAIEQQLAVSKREQEKTSLLLQTVLDSIPDIIGLMDADFNIISYNKAGCEYFAISKEEANGLKCHQLVGNAEVCPDCVSLKALKTKKPVHGIKRFGERGDWLDVRSYPIVNKDGAVEYIVEHLRDITQNKKAEKAIEASEKNLRMLLQSTNDAIIDKNLKTGKLLTNPQFYKLLGFESRQELGLGFDFTQDHLHPDDKEAVLKMLDDLESGGEFQSMQFRIKQKDGHYKWVLSRGKVFVDNNGKPEKLIITLVDISDSKQHEEALRIAKEKAEESDRLKSAFLANVSHEIRTPMNGIIGFSEILTDTDLTASDREYYSRIIVDSSKQLLSIVNDILDISRIESGQLTIRKHEVVVNELIDELFTEYQPKANAQNLRLVAHRALEGEAGVIISDRNKLRQVLDNLLSNALKFTDTGEVVFGYELAGNELCFYVEDTGRGIPPALHKQVFERFWQAESEISRRKGGTGLGLAISKSVVEMLGGRIWLKSDIYTGSVFSFTIPFEPVVAMPESMLVGKPVVDARPVILIAEDEMLNFLYLQAILSKYDFRVHHVTDGLSAVGFCRKYDNVALVLMDMKMPILNGFEATAQIKQFSPNLPIVAQTAYAMTSDEAKAMEAGCDAYLSKPIKREELLLAVQRLMPNFVLKS